VEAVDGMIEERSEEKQTKKINGYTVHYPNYAIADNTKIIACSMSHLIAIRQAYQNGMDVCVIAEDDVSFLLLGIRSIALEFQKIVRFVKEEKTSCIVSLFQPTGATGNPHSIMIDGKPSWGTQGYIINRIGMERVCTTCFQKDHLLFLGKNDRDFIADYLIYSLCEKVYTVSNSMVYPFNVQKDMVSSLHPEHTNFHIKEAIHAFAQNKHHLHTLSFGDF
jgi:GR25 family glycosyltransferase involved in LPS biosynthesis